jgi:hypothetical protein
VDDDDDLLWLPPPVNPLDAALAVVDAPNVTPVAFDYRER